MKENILFPGLHDYKGPIKGWYTCVHHEDKIIEWSDNIMERIDYIVKEKDQDEIADRLRHIVYVDPEVFPGIYNTDNDAFLFIKKYIRALTDYLYKHVQECCWDGKTIMFTKEKYGNGNGDGYGDGYIYGNGDGYGNGNGDGYGNGNGDGYGNGDGDGYGNGDGDGYIYGDGDGYGDGYGNGNGDGYG